MREKGRIKEDKWEKISELKFNKWYGRIKEKGVQGYLRKKEKWQKMPKFRLGDGMSGNWY